MDEKLRKRLATPLGPLVRDLGEVAKKISGAKPALLVAVGDETTAKLIGAGIFPHICAYDFSCERKPVSQAVKKIILDFCKSKKIIKVKNPAGSISPSLLDAVKKCVLEKSGAIEVEGEEDLAALAFLACAPYGALILYGQPGEGMVWLEADAKNRRFAKGALEKIMG
jgi:hypothetical protein